MMFLLTTPLLLMTMRKTYTNTKTKTKTKLFKEPTYADVQGFWYNHLPGSIPLKNILPRNILLRNISLRNVLPGKIP